MTKLKRHIAIIGSIGLFTTVASQAQTVAYVNPNTINQGTSVIKVGHYTRGKGLEAIQTKFNTVLIDYNANTVEHNGVTYPILSSDCTIKPPSVKVIYGRIALTELTIYYDAKGCYTGHRFL